MSGFPGIVLTSSILAGPEFHGKDSERAGPRRRGSAKPVSIRITSRAGEFALGRGRLPAALR